MKKILSILLSIVMIFSLSVTVFAAEPQDNLKLITTNGYTFEIKESTAEDYSVTRSYNKPDTMARSTPAENETIALLLSLGLTEEQINGMSEKAFNACANARNLYVTTSYTKRNEATNVTTGLPAELAIEQAKDLNERQDNYYLNPESTVEPYGIIDNESTVPGVFEDSYMKITHVASDEGNGDFTFITDSEWLTMPFFRGYDSIGSCAKGGSADPFSGTGYYYYYTTTINGGNIGNPVYSGRIDFTKTEDTINGDWYGYAGVFNLPNDLHNDETGYHMLHKNLKAHFEYTGSVTHPELITNFNTNGSYSHATVAIQFSPSVSIDAKGDTSASIGLSVVGTKDTRIAPLKVTYYP